MKKTSIFLYSIFLITLIPIIIVYWEHAIVEFHAYGNTTSETKQTKTFVEGMLFYAIAWGYIITGALILLKPRWRTPYLVLLVGTVAIVILYYFRIYGLQIPFTNIVIVDFSTDYRDVITRIAQQIIVIPTTALLILNRIRVT